jgi:hypothetical protein
MITVNIDFHCKLCNNNTEFYAIPLDEKVSENETVPSINVYKLMCKKCKKSYI